MGVVGLPRGVRPGKLRRPLRDFLREFGLRKLRGASTHTGHCRGFAVADLEHPEAALQAVAASGGIEICVVGATSGRRDCAEDDARTCRAVAQLSRCCGGKVDSLFPFVPHELRGQLRLDSEAMYSTTD